MNHRALLSALQRATCIANELAHPPREYPPSAARTRDLEARLVEALDDVEEERRAGQRRPDVGGVSD